MLRIRVLDSSALIMMFSLCASAPASAQRPFRAGIGVSDLAPRDGGTHSTGWTATIGYLASTTSETDLFLTRWGGTGFGTASDGVTTFGLESRYFPVEATGVAPYLSNAIGLFKYQVPGGILTEPSDEWSFVSAMGLGLGAHLGDRLWIAGEGRLRFDNGLRSTEYRLISSYGVGKVRAPRSRPGTIAPFAQGIVRLGHGPYQATSPYAGVRFRRDETRHGSVAVDIGVAKVESVEEVTLWMVQPAAEYGWPTRWGRPFLEIGPQMLGFIGGEDDGMRYGLHTGGGVDLNVGESFELGLLSRVTWFQSADGRHQFGLQLGASIGPRLMRDRSALPERAVPEP